MAINCYFSLNNKPMSEILCCRVGHFPAFSGNGKYINNPNNTSVVDHGPLPTGCYYIVGRESGGRLGQLRDAFWDLVGVDRNEWFGLYRDDGKIDDWTCIDKIKRGNFRLHPSGPRGVSEGCITLKNITDFNRLRGQLLKTSMIDIPGSRLRAYGMVRVS